MMKLENQVAIVTGGGNGIGEGVARRFAQEGAAVVIADINEAAGVALAQEIEAAGGRALAVVCDVSDPQAVDAMVAKTVETFGRIDILVNNAALVHHPASSVHFLELPDDIWLKTVAINLTGMFFCSQRVGRVMVKQIAAGEGTSGVIISMSSGGGSRAHRHLMAYDSTKGGIEAATRAMALELAPWNIRVNTIVPGNVTVSNSMGGATGPEAAKLTIPLGRPGTPADIAGAAVYLASADGAYVTGQKLYVDGGMDSQLRSPGVDAQIDTSLAERL